VHVTVVQIRHVGMRVHDSLVRVRVGMTPRDGDVVWVAVVAVVAVVMGVFVVVSQWPVGVFV
jgi:hypothetical protein